jgi:hypothetical protein
VNSAGSSIEVFWLSPSGEQIAQTEKPIKDGNDARINSFNTHQFVVKFLNGYPHNQEVIFAKGPYEESVTVYNENNVLSLDQYSKFDEFSELVEKSTARCQGMTGEKLTKCLAEDLYRATAKERKKNIDITQYRDLMSARLRNYTCADPTLNTSTPLSTQEVTIKSKTYQMNKFLDSDAAKIWTVDDFITEEECSILMKYGAKHLRRATVAGEDGLSTISIHRRAQQASYIARDANDPLWYSSALLSPASLMPTGTCTTACSHTSTPRQGTTSRPPAKRASPSSNTTPTTSTRRIPLLPSPISI